MIKLGLALLTGLLIGPAAQACIAMPENITLEGSTFADALEMSLGTQCQVSLTFTSQAEEKAQKEIWEKQEQEFQAWKKLNAMNYTSIDAYRIEREQRDNIRAKYPDVKSPTRYTLELKDGKACIRTLGSSECKSDGPVLIKENGKPVALLETSAKGAFAFSVNSQGEKDMQKPYLKLTPKGVASADVEAIENGSTIGKMDVAGEDCSQGMSRGLGIGSGGKGNLELRGKEYISEGSGCSGGFTSKDLAKPKGQLLRNGQKVQGESK